MRTDMRARCNAFKMYWLLRDYAGSREGLRAPW